MSHLRPEFSPQNPSKGQGSRAGACSASVWETETEELLEALGLPSLSYAKVNSERDLVISKVEWRTDTLIVL